MRRYLFSLYFLCLTVLFSTLSCKETKTNFKFVLNPAGVDSSALIPLQRFLYEAADLIPESMKAGINRPIEVRFAPLDPGIVIQAPCGASGPAVAADRDGLQHIYGSTQNHWYQSDKVIQGVDLHLAFIPVIVAGADSAKTYPCGHRDLYRLALATLIHETAHIYDFAKVWTAKDEAERVQCGDETKVAGEDGHEFRPEHCRRLMSRSRSVSDRWDYQRLMGWSGWGGAFTGVAPKNNLKLRSPDPYEFTDITENFAVNMEYFLMDSEYACRRPAAHAYFVKHFGEDPFPKRECRTNDQVYFSGSAMPTLIDPSRVYQVQFLLAGKGDQMMSRWGHAMLRFIVCSPERKEVDAGCLKDMAYHVAISFRANVSDLVVSAFQGLLGTYPSQLFIYPMTQVIDEYTRNELRNILSLPLALTEEQKTQLVNRTLELYWGYSGNYYFITNNCATEAADLLRAVLPEDHPFQEASFLSPIGMYEELVKEGLVDRSLLADKAQAKKTGYFFASNRENLKNALALIASRSLRPSYPDLESYLSESTAASRRALYRSLQLPGPQRDRKLTASFFLLESQARRVLEGELSDHSVAILTEGKADSPQLKKLIERYRSPRLQMNPWHMVTSSGGNGNGYGVAIADELISNEELVARRKEFIELMGEFHALVAPQIQDETDELAAVKDNLLYFASELKFD
jgi:hypothetical protein